jgi:hypothetical protein
MTRDPRVQERAEELVNEAHVLIDAIRDLGGEGVDDPLCDPATLARAVTSGLLDSPQLQRNAYARGLIRTRALDGAIVAVDDAGHPVSERERIHRLHA